MDKASVNDAVGAMPRHGMKPNTIALLASACAVILSAMMPGEASPAARDYLQEAIEIIKSRHLKAVGADWDKIAAEAHQKSRGAQTTADTYAAIRWILAELNEPHSSLIGPQELATRNAAATGTARNPEVNMIPTGKPLPSRIGWVEVPPLDTLGEDGPKRATEYAIKLRDTLVKLDGAASCGWIIDLRQNIGGNMWPMLKGLDPLLGRAPFGYFTGRGDLRQGWVRTEYGIIPSEAGVKEREAPAFLLSNAKRPIAILIGPRTMSSGEMVLVALSGQDNVRSFGAATGGFTTGNTVQPLSDGAMLVLTETAIADRNGKSVAGAIQPDEILGSEATEQRAEEWVLHNCKRKVRR